MLKHIQTFIKGFLFLGVVTFIMLLVCRVFSVFGVKALFIVIGILLIYIVGVIVENFL